MTYRSFALLVVVAALGAGPAQAAGEGAGQPAPKAKPAKVMAPRHRTAPAPAASTEQYRATLFHGDAAQQNMERNDRERAKWHPVDHSKDDFFSDWRGLK